MDMGKPVFVIKFDVIDLKGKYIDEIVLLYGV